MGDHDRSRMTPPERATPDAPTDDRHIKSAPARLNADREKTPQKPPPHAKNNNNNNNNNSLSNNINGGRTGQSREGVPSMEDAVQAMKSPTKDDSPFSPPFVFPPLGLDGAGEAREGHDGPERSRPTETVPPTFGQAVHRYYTKDIKRSTSPDPYLYEANLSRIRSFHYQAWLRWMESKKRKQQTSRNHVNYPRPTISPEMRPSGQNLILDMSTSGVADTPPHYGGGGGRYDPQSMIDLNKFTRKRKRDGSLGDGAIPPAARDKPEDLSRHELSTEHEMESRCRSRALEEWSTPDVVKFIAAIPSCREYAHLFEDQLITGQSLTLLSLENLTNNLGMKLGPALTLRASVSQLTDQCVQCTHCLHCHNANAKPSLPIM